MPELRRTLERVAVGTANALAFPAIMRMVRRRDVLILAYHNVVADADAGRGDSSLHLRLSAFVAQIELLRATHEIIPLDGVRSGTRTFESKRPRAVITFDDAYRGTVRLALPELARRGVPATVFVVSAFTGGRGFWWDTLDLGTGAERDRRRARALTEQGGRHAQIVERAAADGLRENVGPDSYHVATEAELEAASRSGMVRFGSHTATHVNLAAIPAKEIVAELTSSRAWLRDRFPDSYTDWLAYPYGLYTPEAERIARESGYAGALALGGSWAKGHDPAFTLPRLNVPASMSIDRYAIRTSGFPV